MFKKYKTKIIAGIIVIVSLVAAFFVNSEMPYNQNNNEALREETLLEPTPASNESEPLQKEPIVLEKTELSTPNEQEIPEKQSTPQEQIKSEPIIENNDKISSPIEETTDIEPVIENASKTEVLETDELTCTMSVRCDTILKNISLLKKEKIDIVPQDGVVYHKQTVTFSEGDSVFDLLVREMKKNKIHLEFVKTPGVNSAYIEGIANLYEFDCGDLSGWMCKINNQFLKTGPSDYIIKDKDNIEWVYTCNLGKDVGEEYEK